MKLRWAVFVSGSGTNLQNFIDLESQLLNQKLVAVVADRECKALERARVAHKDTLCLSPKDPHFNSETLDFLNSHGVNRIFLMGYMRILSKEFLAAWKDPILNLHPSLLPKY